MLSSAGTTSSAAVKPRRGAVGLWRALGAALVMLMSLCVAFAGPAAAVDTTPPSTPTGLAAKASSSTSINVSWKASTDNVGVTGYDIERDGAPLVTVGKVTKYTDSTVTPNSTYAYRIRARDAAGNVSSFTAAKSVKTPPDTYIDSGPTSATNSTSATFTFHATAATATFTCKLDAAATSTCTSPKTYTGLAQGPHTFKVYATFNGVKDPSAAQAAWKVDTTPPSLPTGLWATAPSPTSVQLSWNASTDNLGVAGYDVVRDGAFLSSTSTTTFTDAVAAGATPEYQVRARDLAGNLSALTAPVTPTTTVASDAHLTRAPYLTDLVGLNATVNFATDTSGASASVRFGSVSGGTCNPTTAVSAGRTGIVVNGITESQWKARLTLPAAGQYCYRVYLGATDLLAANASPIFTTQVPLGSTEPFTFAVFGDWGAVDANGANVDQANLMHQIAISGARFAVDTGDVAYPSGSQGNYGDLQQSGANTSTVFGPSFWGSVGQSLPLFHILGNHGLARSDAVHPHFANWPADVAVGTSGGRYQKDTYCCPNGSASADYPSAWYAFDAGTARFYVLTAAWADLNGGTGTPYSTEYLAHWTTSSPEYQWLKADLAAHPSGLKFAFFHYPLYSDQPDETSDTSLQGNTSLEGLLASNGVNIAFNGHAHIYQRNAAASGPGRQGLVSYVTGGGGADVQSLGACSAIDKYAIGWSDSNNRGTACGSAPVPSSRGAIYHYLKVTVSGSTVTVTPTDQFGGTFDVQTYTFAAKPDTFIDSGPPAGSASTSATFAFHASSPNATFTCKLDAAASSSCTSPTTYTGLAEGSHTFTVSATVNGVNDPIGATSTWTVDTTPPSLPGGLAASATSPFSVNLAWTAATDNTGVTGYDVFRDGSLLTTISPATTYTDTSVVGGTTYSYAIRSRDIAGNVSALTAPAPVTTPTASAPVFADGFESGDLSAWTSSAGLAVQSAAVNSGGFAAEGNTSDGNTFAKKTLPTTYADGYARVAFDVKSASAQVNLLRVRDGAGNSIGYLYYALGGNLGFHNDTTGVNTLSAAVPTPGWHALELHVGVNGTASTVEVWLDGAAVPDLTMTADLGTAPIGAVQIGEVQDGRTYDVVFDDAAFGTSRLGPVGDAVPPSVPTGVTATATSSFSVQVGWNASTDASGIAGYDVFRDGALLTTVGATTSYTDSTVLAGSTHSYAVRARDLANNVSALSTAQPVTTPGASAAVFEDGFESGDLSAWTSSAGLTVQSADVRTGAFAADGDTTDGNTQAKKTLPASYPDAFARVAFEVKSQAAQVNLLRLRDAAGNSIGYLYLSTTGRLGFHNDATNTNTLSATSPGPGWHALELHLGVNGTASTVEVWLDDAAVADLSTTTNLGIAPVGALQIGEVQTGRTYHVVFDDAAFGTSRLGAAPPPAPAAQSLTEPTPSVTSTTTPEPTPTTPTPTATPGTTVPAPTASAPIRAAFYYPWFPEAWAQQGQDPFTNYVPTRGTYGIDAATVRSQIADMQYGHISVGVASWFGPGSTTDSHWPTLFTAAAGTGFSWAPYYEPEGISDPAPQQIANDLHYLWATYHTADSTLLTIEGRGMAVFVSNADDATTAKGCDTVDRWNQARQLLQSQYDERVSLDLKVFPGYESCAGTPLIDGWHQYAAASAAQNFAGAPGYGSFSVSPGYWKSGQAYGVAPFLTRDRAQWQTSLAAMRASGAEWQLVTTYNEWGEGTAVESSTGCRVAAPSGTLCDWSGGGSGSEFLADLHNTPLQ